ncbi:unnamed protein product [Leptidea sinapis]|uniref:Glucosylceramidase n=1 Tax=Leptidea sinapis TaxID=189913 RepID=A0A5E4Q0C3_9NEOP|nr:unnamed protein product [Leptidea sinapis]
MLEADKVPRVLRLSPKQNIRISRRVAKAGLKRISSHQLNMGPIGQSIFFGVILCCISLSVNQDLPCAARDLGIEGRSIVCVCNSTYCDTVTRDVPASGSYVTYTSSKSGKRFEKVSGRLNSQSGEHVIHLPACDAIFFNDFTKEDGSNGEKRREKLSELCARNFWTTVTIQLRIDERHQFIEGFGGSVTDAAAYNWVKLSEQTKDYFIRSYFSEEGLEYNIIRTPIGGADFSTHPYTYNETSKVEVKVMASTWSPPVWMKTNGRITGFAQLKPEYYQTFADYHVRFMELYEAAEIHTWSLTTTNEPINGIVPFVDFNSLGWFPSDLGRWVAQYLGPTIRNSRFNDTLIFAMERGDPNVMDYVDGIAVHYYGNFAPALLLDDVHRRYNKMSNALGYRTSWIDWNLCLDEKGGPNWAYNFVDAPILVFPENDEFIKQPMFYAMGHFSKFIPRGSQRITVSARSIARISNVAFITPQGNITNNRYQCYNKGDQPTDN